MRIVSLLTDFGLRDPYVAEMQARILSRSSGVRIVDITHEIERHSIVEGAYLLEMAVPYFPKGSIHVAVVDPGVGSDRLPIIIECSEGSKLVGPDNGLLNRAADHLGIKQVYKIEDSVTKSKISSTFHGRDVFSVSAAKLANGVPARHIGMAIVKATPYRFPSVDVGDGSVDCAVIHIDTFGNVILNARHADMSGAGLRASRTLEIRWKSQSKRGRYVNSYYQGRKGEYLVLQGSQGYVEIASRGASASDRMNTKLLDRITLSKV